MVFVLHFLILFNCGDLGYNNFPMKPLHVEVPQMNMNKCSNLKNQDPNFQPIYPALQICAGGEEGKDSCEADSGSSLMKKDFTSKKPATFTLVGVVSWGYSKCGVKGFPGVYVKVAKYVPWILDSLSK